jgi:NADH-quinone oxidoreductase subunit N
MGFLLIGVACGAFDGIYATLIYLLIYIIMNIGFLQFFLGTFNKQFNRNIQYLTELKYFSNQNGIISIGVAIILFSMAGIPPLAGFFGKYFLFMTAFNSQYYLLVIIGMLTSLISAFYYLRIIKIMWFENTTPVLITTQSLDLITLMTSNQRKTYFIVVTFLIFFLIFNNPLSTFVNLLTYTCQIMQ